MDEPLHENVYEIVEGVRRAKAAWLCGHETIRAQIGGIGNVLQIPLRNLRSPKAMIGDEGPRGSDWGGIYRATQRGRELPPIVVAPGAEGTPLAEVEV